MPEQDARPRQRRKRDAAVAGWAPPPPHVSRIATRHADELQAWFTARYQDHERRVRACSRGFRFFAESASVGGLTFSRAYYRAATVEVSWPPVSFVAAGYLRSGRGLLRWQGGEVEVAGQGILLLPPDEYRHLHHGSDNESVSLSLDTVLRVAEETSGLDRAHVRFTGLSPVSRAAERQWLTTADYIQRGIYNAALYRPLVLAAAEHVVAASMLTTFPNTTMTTEIRQPRDPATVATVRRAMAFIDDNAGHPITLSDIATAVGVVPRTLQYAFRRHRDTSPLGYLRRVRLAQAHEQLLAAEPGDGTTVAAVAARWGYANCARFVAAYRHVYGRAPYQTLRS